MRIEVKVPANAGKLQSKIDSGVAEKFEVSEFGRFTFHKTCDGVGVSLDWVVLYFIP